MSAIAVRNLSKSYLGMLPILSNVTFEIEQGEFYYLTGVSGAGKTTVFRLMMLIDHPDAGSILFNEQDITAYTPTEQAMHRRRIGMVFQDYRLLVDESIEENVALPLKVGGIKRGVIRKRTAERLEQVGLADRRKEKVMGLSGGEKQLVSIARALTLDPEIFFADEPTGNLDQSMAFKVMELIRDIQRSGCTVMVATHDLNLIRSFRARTLLIKDRTIHEVRLSDHRASS